MHWYLVHTKPRQEQSARINLERQHYTCYLPTLSIEKLRKGLLAVTEEPLFPRYLFVQLDQGDGAKSWSPIRSTKGVSRLVSFGLEPARVDERLIQALRTQEALGRSEPSRLFQPGERVRMTEGPFSGIEGVYQMADGERRSLVLIEMLSKSVTVRVPSVGIEKAG